MNKGVNDSSWIKCPPPRSGGDDMLYKDNSAYYTVLQVHVVTDDHIVCIKDGQY